jgi:hypothetical protein
MSLHVRKLDLHVHTPASHDFANKAVTAVQIVQHAISQGLDGIAVTDHNTVNFLDQIQKAAQGTSLTIFPGMEISCGGTQEGSVHVIALFDPTKTKPDLERVLGRLEVRGSGDGALTNKSVNDVIDIISNENGLAVLAHANSTHGALNDIRGNPRIEVVKSRNLLAAEATAGDFSKTTGKKLIEILDGNDTVYKRKLAVYQSSDNPAPGGHQLSTIGSSFTYFKMGEMSIGSLRQCFEDPDSRIIQQNESDKLTDSHPRLIKMGVDGGFLKGQEVQFNSSMNSIIGGTGTGKSLLVEFLRFVLNKPPKLMPIFNDHKEKLNKQLGMHGVISLHLRDGSGEEYEITRELTSTRDPYLSPIQCSNKSTGSAFDGDINSVFPTLIYSQNEILEITRDSQAQLALLENFRDFSKYRTRLSETVDHLKALDLELIKNLTESATIGTLKKDLSTVREQLKKAERGLKGKLDSKILERYIELKDEREALLSELSGYDDLETELSTILDSLQKHSEDREPDLEISSPLVKEIFGDVTKSWKSAIANIKDSLKTLAKAKTESQEKVTAWEKKIKYEEAENAYKAEIKKKSALQAKEGVRKDLAEQLRKQETKLKKAQKALENTTGIRGKRQKLLDELSTLSTGYSKERAEQGDLITSRSGGKLQITVAAQSDTTKYAQALLKLKVGSRAEKTEIEGLIQRLPPQTLIDLVLEEDFAGLSKKGGVSAQMAKNIITELRKEENLPQTLSLQYQGQAEDEIEIKYRKKDNIYYPLSELSMGQKADALIMIALGDGTAPVIIDQPEDALDMPSIWTDICSRIRPVKHGRQFVFTTHNSSISVASDSDQFTILEADGTRGWVAKSGSIDQKPVRDDIIGHLEGGYDSYDLKRRKYGL